MAPKKPIIGIVYDTNVVSTPEETNRFTEFVNRLTELGAIPITLAIGGLTMSVAQRIKDYVQICTAMYIFHDHPTMEPYVTTVEAFCEELKTPILYGYPIVAHGVDQLPLAVEKIVSLYTLVVNAKHNSAKRNEAIEAFEEAERAKYHPTGGVD